MTEELAPIWCTLLELQQLTDSSTITARSHAADEAFAAVLDELKPNLTPPDPESVRQRFLNLTSNRAKKFRARAAAEPAVVYHEQLQRDRADAHDTAFYRQLACAALRTVNPTEATALTNVFGDGVEYRELAAILKKPIGTVKAIVSRARRRVCARADLRYIVDVLRAA